MRDFDEIRREREQRDRSFRIGGEEFTYKASVAPEVLVRWNSAATAELELTETEWLELFDETTLAILDPGQQEKWERVRAVGGDHPLNIGDMRAVIQFLIEEATGRPTGPPAGSSPGGDSTETGSRGESSSPAEATSTDSTPEGPAT